MIMSALFLYLQISINKPKIMNKDIIVRNFSLEILKLSPTECLIFSYIFFEHKKSRM